MFFIGCYDFKALATTYRDPLDGVEGTWTNHLKIGSQQFRLTNSFIFPHLDETKKIGVVQKFYDNSFNAFGDWFQKEADVNMKMDL